MSAQPTSITNDPVKGFKSTGSVTIESEFKIGQDIAFIYNRTDLVLGKITSINPDSTYDLICQVPVITRDLKWEGKPGRSEFKISPVVHLNSRPFLKATPADPRMQVIKVITSLQDLGMENIDDPSRGHKQSSIAAWRDSGKRSRVPRLTEFYAPLVGHFFNPSLFFYRIYCWRAPIQVRGQGTLPEEIRYFPNPQKKPYYTLFSKAFSRYVKEYHENPEKWNRVEIQAILPEDVLSQSETASEGD